MRTLVIVSMSALVLAAAPAVRAQEPAPAAPVAPASPAAPAAPADAPETPSVPEAAQEGPAASEGLASPRAEEPPAKDEAAAAVEPATTPLPFRGSTFVFDQSMSTQTARLETSPQQSFVPYYELWFSLRPRWYLSDKVYLWARFDLYKELTNAQETTLYREDLFGDIWTDLRYATPVPAIHKDFRTQIGARVLFPTSKESQGKGIYVTTGATGSVAQKLTLRGQDAPIFRSLDLSLAGTYQHPFSRATTPAVADFSYARQNLDGRTSLTGDDQLSGRLLTNHQFIATIHGGLEVTRKLSVSLDMNWINVWHYAATGNVVVQADTGNIAIPRSSDDHLFEQSTWFIASAEYALLDELSLGLGYFNLANVLAPNGQRRGIVGGDNVWWSPTGARVFFDVIVNLDKVYTWARKKKPAAQASSAAGGAPL